VVALARHFDSQDATVILSEGKPVEALEGWETRCLVGPPETGALFRGKSQEWVTVNATSFQNHSMEVFDFLSENR